MADAVNLINSLQAEVTCPLCAGRMTKGDNSDPDWPVVVWYCQNCPACLSMDAEL